MFHFVAEGQAFVHVAGMAPIELLPGELVIFPRGSAHEVTHSARGKSIELAEFMASRNGVIDVAAKAGTLICGEFKLDQHLILPATRALPPVVHVRAGEEAGHSALTDTLRLLRTEVETPNFGSQVVVRNLLSLLFVYFMRDWAKTADLEANGWFSAVRTPHIARALACIHGTPQHPWTVETLAKEAGLSRAAFARQFSALVGETPHEYLTRWRMGIAAQLLEDTNLRLSEIAARAGYQTEFALSRAFKRACGMSPTRYRRSMTP
jgi:AraC family transcriptional activator of mtrCDE